MSTGATPAAAQCRELTRATLTAMRAPLQTCTTVAALQIRIKTSAGTLACMSTDRCTAATPPPPAKMLRSPSVFPAAASLMPLAVGLMQLTTLAYALTLPLKSLTIDCQCLRGELMGQHVYSSAGNMSASRQLHSCRLVSPRCCSSHCSCRLLKVKAREVDVCAGMDSTTAYTEAGCALRIRLMHTQTLPAARIQTRPSGQQCYMQHQPLWFCLSCALHLSSSSMHLHAT